MSETQGKTNTDVCRAKTVGAAIGAIRHKSDDGIIPRFHARKNAFTVMRTFYHGTTDVFKIKRVLLTPIITDNKREERRTKYTDKVFFTDSLMSASMYAKKACRKYGGTPVVYIVKPIGRYFNTVNNEYIADKALIVGKAA